MTMRTISKTVTFTRPFVLSAMDGVQPAGTYRVETDEELVQGVSFPVYRRVATVIFLPSQSAGATWVHAIEVDPLELEAAELEAAQERDPATA